MHGADALVGLGGAFLAAAFLARLGGRIGLPTIPLFMIAGIIFGPHTPGIALISDPSELRLVASLGLVFLLFYLGLEFSVDQLVSGGRRLLGVSIAYLLLNVGGGLLFGLALGWGIREALIIAGVLGISSSAIVTKLLLELGRLDRRESPVILGIIVVEDVFLALYLALLQPVLSDSVGAAEAGRQIATAFGFLLVLALIARFGSRIVDALFTTHSEELLVVTAVGLAVLGAGVAEMLGVSDAIGAFMVGMILGSTSRAAKLRQLVHPLRDLFGAIFFFAFGLTIDPAQVFNVWPIVLAAVATTGLLASLAGIVAARSYGFGRSEASAIGLTVFSRGEFSLILATLALAAGLDPRITSLTAGYVLVLAVVGPLAATHSDRIAHLLPAGWFKSQLATR